MVKTMRQFVEKDAYHGNFKLLHEVIKNAILYTSSM